MELDNIQFPLRARGPWSAVDLGFAMARRWWPQLLLVWLLPAGLIYVCFLAIFPDRSWIGLLVAWWCKPLLEQLILYRASRMVFNEEIPVFATLRQFFSIIKTDWLWWITLRRFSATRSFDMPVNTLEGLRGAERQQRKSVLQLRNAGPSMWLTVLMVHLESLLIYGVLGIVLLMKPEHVAVNWVALLQNDLGMLRYLSDALTLLIMASMAPFYVLAGFSLYLNRRIELEGWDIELRFQQIVTHNQSRRRGVIAAALLAGCVACLPVIPEISISHAATDLSPVESRDRIQAILSDDAFHEKRTISRWQRKHPETEARDADPPAWLKIMAEIIERLAGVVKVIATALEGLLWLAVAGVVLFLVYRYRQDLLRGVRHFTPEERKKELPEVLFGMAVTEESVPDDVAGEARRLWNEGQKRHAVSLLYRASLSRLLHRYACPLTSADTERECLGRVNELGMAGISRFMKHLTSQWELVAYGHREIPAEEFERLCQDWDAVIA